MMVVAIFEEHGDLLSLNIFFSFFHRKIKGGEMNFSNADPYLDRETPFFSPICISLKFFFS